MKSLVDIVGVLVQIETRIDITVRAEKASNNEAKEQELLGRHQPPSRRCGLLQPIH